MKLKLNSFIKNLLSANDLQTSLVPQLQALAYLGLEPLKVVKIGENIFVS